MEQDVPINPKQQHSSRLCDTPGRTGWDLYFLTILHLPGESASRHPPSTHHSPPTHPPTNPPLQQYNSSGAGRTDQSTTAAQQYGSTHHSGTPAIRQEELGGICNFLRFSIFRGRARAVTYQAPTTHHPPTDQPTTTAVQQQWSRTYRPIHNGSTAVRRYAPQRHTRGTPEAGWHLFALSYDSPSSGREREPSPTKHPPLTTHSPTNPSPQQYNSSGAGRTDQSTTAAHSSMALRTTAVHRW